MSKKYNEPKVTIEQPVVQHAVGYMFCLNLGLHLLRPGRDSLVLQKGIESIPAFFTVTFICILLINLILKTKRLANNLPKLLTLFHILLILIPLLFLIAYRFFHSYNIIDTTFFIWVSVINLLGISLAWEMIVKAVPRLLLPQKIGFIVSGGTLGCITAYGIATFASTYDLLFAVLAFVAAFIASNKLMISHAEAMQDVNGITRTPKKARSRLITIYAVIIFLYAFITTFLYFQQARLVQHHAISMQDSKIHFAQIGFWVNMFTLPIQLLFATTLIQKFGFYALSILPIMLISGLLYFSFYPTLVLLSLMMAITKIVSFSMIRPSRELLLTNVHTDARNRFKVLIDTAVYRGGDVAGSWFYVLLFSQGLSFKQLALVAIPVCILWCYCFLRIQHMCKQNMTAYATEIQIEQPLKNNRHAQ